LSFKILYSLLSIDERNQLKKITEIEKLLQSHGIGSLLNLSKSAIFIKFVGTLAPKFEQIFHLGI